MTEPAIVIWVALQFGLCAFTDGDWAYAGKIETIDGRATCAWRVGTSGEDSEIGTDIDGHDVTLHSFGGDHGEVEIDGKITTLNAPL